MVQLMSKLLDKISPLELFTASFAAYRINDSKVVNTAPVYRSTISPTQTNYGIIMDFVKGARTDITDADREIALQCLEHYRNKILTLVAERVPFQVRQLITAANAETVSSLSVSLFVQLPLLYKQDLNYQNMRDKIRWASGGYIAPIGQSVHFSGTVLMCRFNSTWGTYSVTVLTDQDQVLKFSSSRLPRNFDTGISGCRITGTGMVSKHYENGISKLNRVRYQVADVLTNTEDNTTM
jgi:hypothetical protein